jgi:sulfur carrier protein ThiS
VTVPEAKVTIRLNLFGELRRFMPPKEHGPLVYSVPAPATVKAVMTQLGIPPEEEVAVSLNGELGKLSSGLKDGDEIILFGPTEGG